MERYKEYKDSGVQWIGEIPSHWELRTLKTCLLGNVSGVWGNDAKNDGYDLICLRVADFDYEHGIINGSNLTTRNYNPSLPVEKIFQDGDLLLEKSGGGDLYPVGRIVRYSLKGVKATCSNFMQKLTTNCRLVNSNYLYYYSFHTYHIKVNTLFYNQTTGIQNLKIKQYVSQKIPVPPLSEQQSIVSFLDSKTKKIDSYISAKEEEIKLLGQAKQKIIADAVTKGLNKDVEMKESGIDWLGDIPAHWGFTKVRSIAKEKKIKNVGNIEDNVLSLSYGNIIRKKNKEGGLCPTDFATYQIVEKDDIILRLTDLQNDHRSLRTGLVKERGIITSAYLCIITKQNPFYLQQTLHSYDTRKVFYGMGGGLRQSMNFSDIGNLYVPVPPAEEQQEIVSYITSKTQKIDTLISGLQSEIDTLKTYKQRLISDVVTGQIKVS